MCNTCRVSHEVPSAEEVSAFQVATRDLVGVALRSLALLGSEVSLPQFRMLAVLSELGRCPSMRVAQALQLSASSVTRMGDRLAASGLVARGADPGNRSVVTLELSERGRQLVEQVMDWRHAELIRILARMDPAERAAAASGLRRFHESAGDSYPAELHGPVPV
jgi:DNA-binding MarR family transcriptional regulator